MYERVPFEEPLLPNEGKSELWVKTKEVVSVVSKYPDVLFGLLFIGNLLTVFILGLTGGIRAFSTFGPSQTNISTNGISINKSPNGKPSDLLGGIILILLLSITFSISFVCILAKLSHYIVPAVLLGNGLFSLIVGVILFTIGDITWGLSLLLLAVVSILFFQYMKKHIAFASVNLKLACIAVSDMGGSLLMTTSIMLALQTLFIFFWVLAIVGAATNESNTTISINGKTFNSNQCSTYKYSTVSLEI